MAEESVVDSVIKGRKVREEKLAVAPEVLGLALAAPWRRLGAILIDMLCIGVLSWLSGPVLGIASGVMLAVLFGNQASAPVALRLFRWICRGLGLILVGLSILALGHWSFLQSETFNLEVLQGTEESVAMKRNIWVEPNASYNQLRESTKELQKQVDELKKEVEIERQHSRTWLGRARGFVGALGVTFGWSGVYFTLCAGLLNGRTPGKLLWGIRAAKINGNAFTFMDGFVRHGGYIAGIAMGLLGFAKVLWEPNRQAVQDSMAATVVVKV